MFQSPIPLSQIPGFNVLGGDSSRARHSKKGNPILKCQRCAREAEEREARERGLGCGGGDRSCRKHRREEEMGCGYEIPEEAAAHDETSEATLDLGDPGLGCEKCEREKKRRQAAADETSEATLDLGDDHDLGCDKCQRGKKRRQAARQNYLNTMPSGWLGQAPLLQQVPLMMGPPPPPRSMGNGGRGGRARGYMQDEGADRYCDPAMEPCPLPLVSPLELSGASCPGHARMGQTCPAGSIPLDPTLNCQRDARGNAVCSNGMYFPPGCPKTPPEEYFSPGIAPDEVKGGILQAKIPPPRAAGTTGAAGVPATVPAAGGAAAPSNGGVNILPIAAGGLAVAGLLYAILR